MRNKGVFERVLDEKNIYSAIYALETFVFEKELLTKENTERLNRLSDKYDKEYIKGVIKECQQKIKSLLTSDDLIEINVFFKPKKLINNNPDYRPIHTADLISQICIVSMLNVIMFEDTDDKRKLSDISKLLPSNFYGNIPSPDVENLFEPWNKKYKEYSEKAIEASKLYSKNKKYKYEVNLDLCNFFPSINPNYIYQFILDKLPVTYSSTEKKEFEVILRKLLFFRVAEIDNCIDIYYKDVESDKLEELKKREVFYNNGVPQGLPQSYYFGNLCMLLVAKEINDAFEGDSYYYVDDSVIFTNNEDDFYEKINVINESINNKLNKQLSYFIGDSSFEEFNKLMTYEIMIHNKVGGKSTKTEIVTEDYLYQFAKPASSISFEIKASLDETEDLTLKKKINAILEAIDDRIEILNSSIGDNKKAESRLKLLNRYEKFYKYRLKLLELRDNNEITEEVLNIFLAKYGIGEKPDNNLFFSKIDNDIFYYEAKLLLKYLKVDETKRTKLIAGIKYFERNLNPVLNHYSSVVLTNSILVDSNPTLKYKSLIEHSLYCIEPYSKVKPEKSISSIKKIIRYIDSIKCESDPNSSNINKFFTEYQSGFYEFAYKNSSDFFRKPINSLISQVLNIEANDSCNFFKRDNRALFYFELRLLTQVRMRKFEIDNFVSLARKIFKEIDIRQNYEKVDLALFEVLPVFNKYVAEPTSVDNLIQTHKYVNTIWKNGSKFLHFFTLHNEEHSIELIKSSVKITKAIDYLSIKREDYYHLFLACYLHDISMVIYPNLDSFVEDTKATDIIYSKWKSKLKNSSSNIQAIDKSEIKRNILESYKDVNTFFEDSIRGNHTKKSAKFIKEEKELSFIEPAIRQIVANISEAHGYDAKDVYKIKSKAKSDFSDEKYLMIILRLADLLDMTRERVSLNILSHNINNMSDVSKYHWISHLAIDSCGLNTDFEFINNGDNASIKERVQVEICINTQQLTAILRQEKCTNKACKLNSKDKYLSIVIDKDKSCTNTKCNFLCKWMVDKQYYLFNELHELKQYLDRNINNIFTTEFEVRINYQNSSTMPNDYMDIVMAEVEN